MKNNFFYSDVVFIITEDELVQFTDKYGELVTIEPSYVSAITEMKNG